MQQANGTLGSTAYAQGSTTKTVSIAALGLFTPRDYTNCFVEHLSWRIAAGVLSALVDVRAQVTGPDTISFYINSPVAQTLTIAISGALKEYG